MGTLAKVDQPVSPHIPTSAVSSQQHAANAARLKQEAANEAPDAVQRLLLSDPAGSIADAVNPFGNLEQKAMQPAFWLRIAFVVGGILLILIAVGSFLGKDTPIPVPA